MLQSAEQDKASTGIHDSLRPLRFQPCGLKAMVYLNAVITYHDDDALVVIVTEHGQRVATERC